MELRDLYALHALVQSGTTKSAAVNIGVSQPTISRAIVEMESHFGRQLFARHHGRLIPTAAALRISRTVEEISGILGYLKRDLTDVESERTLKVGLSLSHNSTLLQAAVRRFMTMHEDVAVTIKSVSDAELPDLITSGAIDVGFSAEPLAAEGALVEQLLSLRVCCVMSARHRLADEASITPEQLAGESVIGLRGDGPIATEIRAAFREAGVTYRPKLEVSSVSVAHNFAASGMGIALCPSFKATPGDGVVSRELDPAIECRLFSMLRKTGPMQQVARQFCRLVRMSNAKVPDPALDAAVIVRRPAVAGAMELGGAA